MNDEGSAKDVRVVAAVVEREGRYLLGLRPGGKRHGGQWEFPGGKLEEGESVAEAAARELLEELELVVAGVGAHLRSVRDGDSPFLIEFYSVAVRGDPVAHEHDDIGWFEPGEFDAMPLAPADRAFAGWLSAEPAASG